MSKHTFEVTDASFQHDVIDSETPILVDFWAEWCGPCKMISPLVDEIAQEYDGKLRVAKMDVDANNAIPQSFDIQGIPTLILFKGGQPVQQIVGYKSKEQLKKAIASHLN